MIFVALSKLLELQMANSFYQVGLEWNHKRKRHYWQLMVDDGTKIITFLESVPRNYPETMEIYSQAKIS